jgi:hypothetical protein
MFRSAMVVPALQRPLIGFGYIGEHIHAALGGKGRTTAQQKNHEGKNKAARCGTLRPCGGEDDGHESLLAVNDGQAFTLAGIGSTC